MYEFISFRKEFLAAVLDPSFSGVGNDGTVAHFHTLAEYFAYILIDFLQHLIIFRFQITEFEVIQISGA